MRSAVNRVGDLPTPIENLGTLEEPLEKINHFPILRLLLESDARLREPLQYLSTPVGLIHDKLNEISSGNSLNENLFEKAVKEARKILKKEKRLSI